MFPMEVCNVSQRENEGSHLGTKNADLSGKDRGKDKVYCPCTSLVKRVRKGANGELYLWSQGDVITPCGYVGPVTITLIHDEAFNVKEGTVVKQGEYFYDEGGMSGGRPGYFGNHIHIEVVKGHVTPRQVKNSLNCWYTPGEQLSIDDAFFLGNDVIVLNPKGYNFKRRADFDAPKPVPAKLFDVTYRVSKGDVDKVKAAVAGTDVGVEPTVTGV